MTIFISVYHLSIGGTERVASLWAKGFAERGHKVFLILGNGDAPVSSYSIPDNVDIRVINSHRRISFFRSLERLYKLRKLIVSEKPDLIIGTSGRGYWSKMLLTIDRKVPVINTDHTAFERPASAPMSRTAYIDKFYKNKIYDRVTVLSQADKNYIGKRLPNTVVLPNPLPFLPIEDNYLEQKQKIVLAAGRLWEWHCKGFDNLIRAWGDIKGKHPDWKLRILGTGGESDLLYLKMLASECGVRDSVEFAGWVDHPEEEYRKASVFVLSSRYEGFGMVLIEAMSQGCACVACDWKGRQREIITSEDEGLICPPDDYQTLGNAIHRVLADETLRRKLQRGAIRRSSYYSLDKTMYRWEAIINGLK